jgi:hypothetical protein
MGGACLSVVLLLPVGVIPLIFFIFAIPLLFTAIVSSSFVSTTFLLGTLWVSLPMANLLTIGTGCHCLQLI